ncbi:hypothetical protein SPRG_05277 [Saprolegnia parasitica CBS 223.65]|uniref:Uncharacterized protein n=1 Tax=Saprolegnia parasitica (strain CBS 223.65) TaxID=695850 RepID=A0A067CU72_SAPPC|nr:hypothetical protein SPRG_05277 [Saprolegnia parasitica CBS 223.65]KDO30086.1 hypothetical protein SPRG_05277 [Saprolegnia parasitica CBS 223.65]|eukprot:XP_012199267.1 hypothetical protein SPRG_05277 [Saprolegnia parasitica CBS 223.65]
MPSSRLGGDGTSSAAPIKGLTGRSGSFKDSVRRHDSAARALPLFGRQGSVVTAKGGIKSMPSRGIKTSHYLHMAQKGPPDIKQLMEDVYLEMERQRTLGVLKIPLKFTDFYNADITVLFVRAAMDHVDSIVALKILEKNAMPEVRSRATQLHAETLSRLATSYSRIVLHCSNFERQKEDEVFFECVYYFVCAIVKVLHAPEHWHTIEEELGYAFRGESFNINGRGHLRVEPVEAKPPTRFGAAAEATESLRFVTASTNERYGAFIQMVGVNSIVARVDSTKARVDTNLRIAQTIRDRINAAHRTEVAARTTQELEFQKRNATRMEVYGHAPAKPMHGPSAHGPYSPRLNMRATLDARSPVVARILPPPSEAGSPHKLGEVQAPTHASPSANTCSPPSATRSSMADVLYRSSAIPKQPALASKPIGRS